jgi:fucose permease
MKQSTKTALGYYLVFISLGLTLAALGPTLPGLAEQTRTTLGGISLLFVARSLGFLIGALLVGRLYDRFPGHRLMTVSLVFIAGTMALVPLIPSLWLLTGVMFLLGLFEPGLDVGGNTLIVWVYRDKVGPYMNGLHFFFGIGAFVAPAVVAWALATGEGVAMAYWVLAALILLPAPYIALQPSPTAPERRDNRPEGRANRPLVLLLAFFFFLYAGAEISFGGWIFSYAAAMPAIAAEAAAGLTSLFWIAFTAGRLLAVPLSVRLRHRTVIIVDLIGAVGGLAVILVWPNSVPALWVGTILIGVFMASVFPTTLSLAERHLHVSGQTTSYFFAGASIGGMTIPWLIGQLFEPAGPASAMAVILVSLLLAMGLFGLILWRTGQPGPGRAFVEG